MHVTLKCFATLGPHQPADAERFPIREGETVAEVIQRLGIADDEVRIIFVNSKTVPAATVLADGDRVGLFPAVGGG